MKTKQSVMKLSQVNRRIELCLREIILRFKMNLQNLLFFWQFNSYSYFKASNWALRYRTKSNPSKNVHSRSQDHQIPTKVPWKHTEMEKLSNRRTNICLKPLKAMEDQSHRLHCLFPDICRNPYQLRNSSSHQLPKFKTNCYKNSFVPSALWIKGIVFKNLTANY
jgi:hypothetical protein